MPRRVPCGVCADGSARERGEFARGVGWCASLGSHRLEEILAPRPLPTAARRVVFSIQRDRFPVGVLLSLRRGCPVLPG